MTVEDGTGLATANSYASTAYADTYFSDRGIVAWDAVDEKEAALIRGTQALDGMYHSKWPGTRSSLTQGLDWPRIDAEDMDGFSLAGVPSAVVKAACEAALIESASIRALTPAETQGIRSEQVGPIKTEYFASNGSSTAYPVIKQALASIVPFGGVNIRRG